VTPRTIQGQLRALAMAGVVLFLLIVVIEHLVSSLDPATHEISEYVHGRLGWLMTAGFAVWAVSLAAAGLATSSVPRGKYVGLALLVAAVGMALTACFATQTSAGRLSPGASLTTTGRLHDIGSGATTIALLLGVLLSLRIGKPRALRRATMSLLLFVIPADVLLLVIGSEVAGIRQRLLVVGACVWQMLLLAGATPPAVPAEMTEAESVGVARQR
jgi:hypothetical protein